MKSAKSTCGFSARSVWILVLSLSFLIGCGTVQIPDVNMCKKIPFVDAPEGVCRTTVSKKETFIGPKEWAKMEPYLISFTPESWGIIANSWLKACREAGKDCTNEVNSIGDDIKRLDDFTRKLIGPLAP